MTHGYSQSLRSNGPALHASPLSRPAGNDPANLLPRPNTRGRRPPELVAKPRPTESLGQRKFPFRRLNRKLVSGGKGSQKRCNAVSAGFCIALETKSTGNDSANLPP